MGGASERIRISEAVKRELERRKREGESFNDVLERVFSTERDLLAGFGRWSAATSKRARRVRATGKRESGARRRDRTE